MSIRFLLYVFFFAFFIGACAVSVPSASQSGPRTIVLDGTKVSEAKMGGFTCWFCKDSSIKGSNLVEVGFYTAPGTTHNVGFILYENGYDRTKTTHERKGLE